jgi:hypothetical protein
MRLKLFAVPHFCIFLPVVFNREIQECLFKRRISWANALIVVYIGLLAFQGQKNVQKQLSISGEFNNESQEKLFRWIDDNTAKGKTIIFSNNLSLDAVFSGSMALMANLKLSTLRPIFNHPHYEDEGIRLKKVSNYENVYFLEIEQ